MGSLPPYPEYSDSGLAWLPRVPSHWEVRRNGRIFAQRVETGREELPILEVSLRTGVRVRSFGDGGRKQVMADRSKYKRAAAGDVAYNMMRLWQGAVGVAPEDGLVSPAYVVAAPYGDVDPRYFAYLFRTADYMREVESFSRGIVADRNRLYWGQFKQMPSPCPPLAEQKRIADYLDAHGRLTNRLIRNRRKLLAVLDERKRIARHQILTRGPNATSAISTQASVSSDALPSGWSWRRLKHVCRLWYGDALPDTSRAAGDVEVYGSNGPVGLHSEANTHEPCVIVGRKGSFGKVCFSAKAAFVIDTAFFVDSRCTDENLEWLYHLLSWAGLDEISKDAAVPGLDRGDAYEKLLPWCPPEQQGQVVNAIKAAFLQLEISAARTARLIELAVEYRDRMIVDLVTGALDVRVAGTAVIEEDSLVDDDLLDDEGTAEDDDEADPAIALAEADE
jgi:type I restriction enzyme S subunit